MKHKAKLNNPCKYFGRVQTPKMAKEVIPVAAKLLAVKIWQQLKFMTHN
jgi:hypothetical protein